MIKKLRALYRLLIVKDYFLVTCHKDHLTATVAISQENADEAHDYISELLTGMYDEGAAETIYGQKLTVEQLAKLETHYQKN